MHSSEKERLLRDTLHDADYARFRDDTFAAGLRVLRSEQRPNRTRQLIALAAMIALLLSVTIWWRRTPAPSGVVHNSPAPPPRSVIDVVRSVSDPSLEVATGSQPPIETVETKSLAITQVDDKELLTLFGNRPVAFVRHGARSELIILGN